MRTPGRLLPHAQVAANLGVAGVDVVAAPLINATIRICSIFPSLGWSAAILGDLGGESKRFLVADSPLLPSVAQRSPYVSVRSGRVLAYYPDCYYNVV